MLLQIQEVILIILQVLGVGSAQLESVLASPSESLLAAGASLAAVSYVETAALRLQTVGA